jgi:serum/glucocorticoid-regulated kinase 2
MHIWQIVLLGLDVIDFSSNFIVEIFVFETVLQGWHFVFATLNISLTSLVFGEFAFDSVDWDVLTGGQEVNLLKAVKEFVSNLANETSSTLYQPKGEAPVTLNDFELKSVIGRGSFGKVFLVIKKSDPNTVYAMKALAKNVILEYDQVESTKLERDILNMADHPFLVGMKYVFQTASKIFFVMRFVRGGELFSHLRKKNRFEEDLARFYALQVCHAIGYLHDKKIIYRDLKPENILMDENGYLCLTDFGLAKILQDGQQANTFCGTPDYLAPEILSDSGHGFPVDWWAIGILTYEMIVGCPPFFTQSNNYEKMYQMIKKRAVHFPDPERYKIYMSDECKDFISKLLEKDPNNRLGTKGGISEVL